jgi:outer membrane protein assembly factor BamB
LVLCQTDEIRKVVGLKPTLKIGTILAIGIMMIPVFTGVVTNVNAASISLQWSVKTGLRFGGGLAPLAVDINGDKIPEIFAAGDNSPNADRMYCLDGRTGKVIWMKTLPLSIAPHSLMEIYDLNKDGQYEIVQSGPNGMMVFRANTGALIWQNTQVKGGEEHQLVLDTDRTGYPYIYTVNGATDGSARLDKVDGRTGKILISKNYWYACHGGLSAADVDHDGNFEIFATDRNSGKGNGIQCYDAKTLTLKWSRPTIGCSSHLAGIVDVNNDGILDVVVSQQRDANAGLYCLDGRTGKNIPGKCQDSIAGFAVHETMPIYDIDGDGRLEIASCSASTVKVFDIGLWKFDATLAFAGKSPYFANVWGDSKLEIILSDQTTDIKVYDSGYHLVSRIPVQSYGSNVQDVDGDGLNELIVYAADGTVRLYNTPAQALSPLPRTNTEHFSERRTRAAVYVPPPTTTMK